MCFELPKAQIVFICLVRADVCECDVDWIFFSYACVVSISRFTENVSIAVINQSPKSFIKQKPNSCWFQLLKCVAVSWSVDQEKNKQFEDVGLSSGSLFVLNTKWHFNRGNYWHIYQYWKKIINAVHLNKLVVRTNSDPIFRTSLKCTEMFDFMVLLLFIWGVLCLRGDMQSLETQRVFSSVRW